MLSTFCVTSSKKTKFLSSLRRLGSYFSSRVLLIVSASVAAALLPAVACTAAPLTLRDAVFSVTLGKFNVQTGDMAVESYSSTGDFSFGGASATVSGLPRPSLTGHAEGVDFPLSPITASSMASMTYQFDVDRPWWENDQVEVPLSITWVLHLTASGDVVGRGSFATASFRFTGSNPSDSETPYRIARAAVLYDTSGNLFSPDGSPADNSGSQNFVFLSDTAGDVLITSEVRATGEGYDADAFVDPYISIDPDWLLAHPGYSVRVSAGIGNIPTAVPEPETYALMLAGLGLLGFVARRRKQNTA